MADELELKSELELKAELIEANPIEANPPIEAEPKVESSSPAKRIDLTGQRFGKLLVLGLHSRGRHAKWRCMCDCGKRTIVRADALKSGATRSCGSPRHARRVVRTDLVGRKFGRLQALALLPELRGGSRQYQCLCDCGRQKIVTASHLEKGDTQSCGCLRDELLSRRNFQHGLSHTKEHKIWRAMIRRCENPKDTGWKYYGGRGITVCEAWKDFRNFLADMGPKPPGMSLDRIDYDGPYCRGNVRWATAKQQANNRHCRGCLKKAA